MKKRNRVLALILAIALTITSVAWDIGGAEAAESNENVNATTESTQPEKINFDNIDVSTLTDFTSTQLDSNSYALIGEANQAVGNHWFSGASNPTGSDTNSGLKPKTIRNNNRHNLLKYKDSYGNFKLTAQVYWNTNVGIVIGAENTYPLATTTNAILIATNQGNLRVRGAIDESSAVVTGTRKYLNTNTKNQCVFGISSSSSTNLDGTTQTINVKVQDGVLKVWVDGYNEVLTVNISSTYPTRSNITLWAMGYDNKIGFKSFRVRDLDAVGYTDFENIAPSSLTDFTSTQLDSNSYALIGTAKQAVENHWISGLVNPDNSKTNSGLKPKTIRNNNKHNLLNYKYSYEDFELKADVNWNTNVGIVIGVENTYPLATTTNAILIATNQGNLRVRGAVDESSAVVTGTRKYLDTNTKNQCVFGISSSSGVNLDGTTQSINVKLQDGVLTVWVDGYDEVLTVNVSSTYPEKSNITLWAMGYNNKVGFQSLEVRDLDKKVYGFNNADVATLTDFASTQLDSNSYALIGTADQAVGTHWFSGVLNPDGSKTNNGLKPKSHRNDNKHNFLNYKNAYENFEATVEVCWNTNVGIVIGAKNTYPLATTTNAILIATNQGNLRVRGAIDESTAEVTGTRKYLDTKTSHQCVFGITSSSSVNLDGTTQKVNIKMQDGVLTVWVDGYNEVLTVSVSGTYPQTSNIALWAMGYSNKIGFKSFAIKEIKSAVKQPAVQAQVGEGFSEEFLPSDTSFKVSDLNEDFSAYYFASSTADTERGAPSRRWADSDWGIRPTHDRASGAYTLLTYDKLIFKNVEVTTKYQRNWGQYAIMIAPEGEIASVANHGIKAWVESNGRIRVTGAIDAGSATATGGYVTVLGQGMVAGYDITDYASKATEKFYNLHVKIEGKVLYIWMDEIPEYVISVNVTDEYQGGVVSLYSNGRNDGGYGSFTAVELQDPNATTTAYTQSFNTIDSLSELKDFTAYTLDSVENKAVEVNLEDTFQLKNGKLQATSEENGKDDRTNFSILTLNSKEYKNFELTLKYEQARMQRYGIMFGTELGEFAYSQKGSRLAGNGGAYIYTEAEGYRNVRGSMYSSSYTKSSEVLHRDRGETQLDSFWWYNDDVMNNVQRKTLHTMTVRVVGEYMTVVIDNNEDSRVTVHLSDYEGGYISLVSDAAAGDYGAFAYLAITELDDDAKLEAEVPEVSDGFETLTQVDEMFDAYYLTDAKTSSKLEKVELKERWWLNDGGFLSRTESASGYVVTEDVDVLTYTKQKYTDFEMTYTYQQNWLRMGVLIGEELGEYPLSYVDGKLAADQGVAYYLEAEGYSNVQGYLNNMTNKDTLLYRVTNPAPDGFKDGTGSVTSNIGAKKVHTVKIVVKDKQLYVFLDGNEEKAALYVHLGDNYKGGYISLFAHAASGYGFNNFSITDKVTTKLPEGSGTSASGNTFTADFDTTKFDYSAFTTYYLAKTKGNADGKMEQDTFEDQWTLDNGHIESNNMLTSPSSKNLEEFEYDDSTMVSVLTYNKKMTDFIVSYDFQKTPQRLMFMFGTEMGKFALAAPNTTQKAQGVLLYPENDLGAGGGLVALGNLATYNSSMRPLNRQKVNVDGYHIKDKWASNVGTWHTMTIAVMNNHCYVYLDDYGMIADYELSDYNGGYISLATTGRSAGFDNLKITDLSVVDKDTIVAATNPSDITVKVGTAESELKLPSTIKVTLKNGKKVDAPVKWVPLQYNPNEAGVYQFTAVAEGENPAKIGARLYVKVVEKLPTSKKGVKEWTFDTPDDLKDFKATYLKNEETGYLKSGAPNWYVNASGQLTRDAFRAVNGDQYKEIAILTYTGEKYTNFELEVEYTQQWQRMMVLFGSETAGEYINLKDIYAVTNPVAGYVEMEGVRNFIGNLINANFDSNDENKINNARESGVRLENYYDEVLYGGNQGKKHTMKIRVVGDQAMMWVDDAKEPYVCTLTNYDGGYISLVSTCKTGYFDNLKITRLNAQGEPEETDPAFAADGTLNISIDEDADTGLVVPEKEKPDSFEDVSGEGQQNAGIPTIAYVIGGSTILLALIIGALLIAMALKKKKQKEES